MTGEACQKEFTQLNECLGPGSESEEPSQADLEGTLPGPRRVR